MSLPNASRINLFPLSSVSEPARAFVKWNTCTYYVQNIFENPRWDRQWDREEECIYKNIFKDMKKTEILFSSTQCTRLAWYRHVMKREDFWHREL